MPCFQRRRNKTLALHIGRAVAAYMMPWVANGAMNRERHMFLAVSCTESFFRRTCSENHFLKILKGCIHANSFMSPVARQVSSAAGQVSVVQRYVTLNWTSQIIGSSDSSTLGPIQNAFVDLGLCRSRDKS